MRAHTEVLKVRRFESPTAELGNPSVPSAHKHKLVPSCELVMYSMQSSAAKNGVRNHDLEDYLHDPYRGLKPLSVWLSLSLSLSLSLYTHVYICT